MSVRRHPTAEERLTPCECCGHPVSHRHHLLSVANYGDIEFTVQLCPNCHELVHWCFKEHTEHRWRWGWIWTQFVVLTPTTDPRIKYIERLVKWMIDLNAAAKRNDMGKLKELARDYRGGSELEGRLA